MTQFDEKAPDVSFPNFTHAGVIHDPSLNQLRDQIKKVMIPLLIKIFQLKLELNQTLSPPSQIQGEKNPHSSQEIIMQLEQLDKDLKVLILWSQSCRKQIEKALIPSDEELKSPIANATSSSAHSAVSKSFANALFQHTCQEQKPKKQKEEKTSNSPSSQPKKKWWKWRSTKKRF